MALGLNPFDDALDELDQEQQPSAPVNPFAETLAELDGAQDTAMRGALKAAQQTTPDARAEAMRLADQTGLPVEVIERNLDDFRKRVTVAETPYERMRTETPHLADWATDPNNAAVSSGDIANLGALEWLFTAPQRAIAQGINQVRFGKLKAESLFRPLTRAEQDLADSYRVHMTLGGDLGADGAWWREAIVGAGQLLPNIGAGAAMAAKYGAVGALEIGAVGALGGSVLPGVGTVSGGIGGATLGARSGALYGAAKFGFQLEAGLALDEYEQFTDETGRPIEPEVARAAALATGLLNAGLEAYGLKKLAETIPGVKTLTKGASRAAVKEALKRPTVRAGLAAAMRAYGGVLTAETATEVAQRAATILSGELAKMASSLDIEQKTGPEIVEELITEGVAAVRSFALVALPGPTMQVAHARAQAQAAQGNVDFFTQIGQGMASSETLKRAPAAVQDLIERAVAAGPVPNVYAPVDTWTVYWQEKGLDPAEVAADVTGNPRALEQAALQGGLLKIPTSAYAVKLAPTEHNAFLASELKMAPDEMNTREAQAFQEREAATAETTRQQAMTPEQQVTEQLQAKLEGAQFPTQTAQPLAQLVSSAIGRLATDAGFDPVDVFQGYGMRIERKPSADAPVAAAETAEPGAQPTADRPDQDTAQKGPTASQAPATAPIPQTTYSPALRALMEEDLARLAAQRGTEGDVPDTPAARELERERRAAEAAYARTQLDRTGEQPQTSESEVGPDGDRVETGERSPDAAGERVAPDVRGGEQGRGDGARAERRRLPTAAEIAGTEGDTIFARATPETDATRLTPEVTRELARIAEELGEFGFVGKTWTWLEAADKKTGTAAGGDADIVGGAAGAPVYDDILNYAPLNKSSKGEGAAKTSEQSRAKVEAAVRKVLATGTIHNNLAEGAVRVAERRAADDYRDLSRPILPPTWGVEAPAEVVQGLSDAIDDALAEADDSFEPSEFGQSLFDVFEEAERTAPSKGDLPTFGSFKEAVDFITTHGLKGTARSITRSGGPRTFALELAPDSPQPPPETLVKPTDFAPIVARVATRKEAARAAADGATEVELSGEGGRRALAGPDMSKPGRFRLTRFDADGPVGHTEHESLEQAVFVGLNYGYTLEQVDVLDTGEQQPRLPGAGDVREQDIATPEIAEVPFALEREERTPAKGKQTTLFQDALDYSDDQALAWEYMRLVTPEDFDYAVATNQVPVLPIDMDRAAVVEVVQAARADEARTNARTLHQERRGAITIQPDRTITISLFEKADLSTFLHESGHFFLELYGDVTARVLAIPEEQRTQKQQRIVSDYAALLKHLGVERRNQIGTAQHEQFARNFEAYLMEGKAPSLALQEIFSTFRAWLLGVYRSLRRLNADLTPEVRRIFDRMLATDQEIAAAEARGGFQPMFLTAEEAGYSPAEFELYRQDVEDASRKGREELDAKLLGEVRREQERQWKAERATIREAVAAEAYLAPVYRALAAIRFGQNPDGSSLLEGMDVPPLKLSRQILVDRYGADRLKRLPKPYVYTTTGGVDPDLVAERFGFSSGDELLQAIEQAEPMQRAIDRETDARMIAQHGSLLLDGTVPDAAQAAAANTIRDAVLRRELRALWAKAAAVRPFVQQAKREGADALKAEQAEREYERRWLEAETKLRIAVAEGRKQVDIDRLEAQVRDLKARARGGAARIREGIPSHTTVQQVAAVRIAATRVQDLTPAVFWAAARKAAAQAIEHAARQDFDAAITAKTQELLNVALYREAERAKADAQARVARARDLGSPKSRARIALAGSTFLEQIDGILDRYNFVRLSGKALDRRARMRDWLEALEAEGLPADADAFPPEVLDDLRRVDYQTVPYAELVGITDGLTQIVHLAQIRNRQLKTAAGEAFSDTRDALATSIAEHNVARTHPLEFDNKETRRHSIARAYAAHLKIGTLARMLDGGKDGGRFWTHIIQPLNKAADLEQSRRREEATTLQALLDRFYPGRDLATWKEKVFIPAIGGSLTKEARLAAVLTRGNADGLARLLVDPTRRWTQAGLDAIASTLDANDLAFINAMWAHLDRFWPEIAAKEERITGLAPERVEAQPFAVRASDGGIVEMTGGYYPLLYDERLTARAARNVAVTEAKLASAAAYVSATTRRGHTKARVSNVRLSVRLDMGVPFQHVDQVIHDLTHHETLIEVTRLLRDQKVSEAIYSTRGPAVYRQFTQAISAIAVGTAPESDLDKAATFMRTGAQIAGLGWNLWTGLQQPLGLFNGMERVGVKWIVRGARRWMTDAATLQNTVAWIADVSPFMAQRTNTATQDIMQLREALGTAGGWFDTLIRTVTADRLTQQHLLDSFLWHIGIMQRVADVPTWLGAYEKAMADPANDADETRAVALADQAVIDSQGSGHIKDLADVQRGSGVAKLWLTFYSYGSTTINRAAAIADRGARQPLTITTMLGHYLMLYVLPSAFTIALANAVGRRNDDDAEEMAAAIASEALGAALNGVVLVRELAATLTDGTRGYVGPAGARLLEVTSKAIQQVKQGEADDALFRAINASAGILFRYPAGQVQRTVDGWIALQEGQTSNPAALLFGAPKE